MSASDKVEGDSLKFWLNADSAITAPTDLYMALFNAAPDDDGGSGTEVSGSGYARVQLTPTGADAARFTVTEGDPSSAVNATDIEFAQASGSWGTVVSAGLYSAASGGDFLFNVSFTDGSFAVPSGGRVRLGAGSLTVTAT